MAVPNGHTSSLTNYIAYVDKLSGLPRIGHFDSKKATILPLSYLSGTPITNLYEVIEVGEKKIQATGEPIPRSSVTTLPPISGRDVLAVGKNYSEHAKEFNASGYDSSDKVDIPSHPVIFTKRETSIIADGQDIFPHPGFTATLDYEGEIGVIVGKSGFKVAEADAMDYVWGYTIINDVTARERQRDHKQFYIGKSADTFCPMGPVAIPKEHLPKVLRVSTQVNGEQRQTATTEDLIFSVPFLIHTLSEGQTLRPGDVLATGTPAGVGFGLKPPVFLKEGDVVEVSITGLGSLKNTVASPNSKNYVLSTVEESSHVSTTNLRNNGLGLSNINSKPLYYKQAGASSGNPIVFVHGLGGSNEFYTGLSASLGASYSLHSFDLEGHGLSPTSALSTLSISSFAADVAAVFQHAQIKSGATLVAHSMGCLIALDFVLKHPDLVKNLILLGPPPSPLPEAASTGSYARAKTAREQGMIAVVDAVASAGTSENTKKANPVGLTAVRLSLLGQDPEGYAKACAALAGSATQTLGVEKVKARTLIVTGEEDKVSPPALCERMKARMPLAEVVVLPNVGHWHLFEDLKGVSIAVETFLRA